MRLIFRLRRHGFVKRDAPLLPIRKVRHVRRDGLDIIKKLEKNHEISEDDQERFANDVQKATDGMIAEIDQLLAAKEKEILTV